MKKKSFVIIAKFLSSKACARLRDDMSSDRAPKELKRDWLNQLMST